MQSIITIGVQMLDILEKFHSLGYVHNDMKPQNMMTKLPVAVMGGGCPPSNAVANQVYLIDFGLTMTLTD